MTKPLSDLLSDASLSPTEYAVMGQIADGITAARDCLAEQTAQSSSNFAPADSVEACLNAIVSLLRKGLLIELSPADIEADLARWRAEPFPVSVGVNRDRFSGDIDLTEAGFQLLRSIEHQEFPERQHPPRASHNDDDPEFLRLFGETEDILTTNNEILPGLPRDPSRREPIRRLGPWWYSRFELVPTGFEILVHRTVRRPFN